ncbi:hypothetical protein BC830DRAFT_1169091 [Chytriomyces sp. MP71]|nr:hypothetical protein BC830DRAFT_1169091 [Chytriomyces sp. MP71]
MSPIAGASISHHFWVGHMPSSSRGSASRRAREARRELVPLLMRRRLRRTFAVCIAMALSVLVTASSLLQRTAPRLNLNLDVFAHQVAAFHEDNIRIDLEAATDEAEAPLVVVAEAPHFQASRPLAWLAAEAVTANTTSHSMAYSLDWLRRRATVPTAVCGQPSRPSPLAWARFLCSPIPDQDTLPVSYLQKHQFFATWMNSSSAGRIKSGQDHLRPFPLPLTEQDSSLIPLDVYWNNTIQLLSSESQSKSDWSDFQFSVQDPTSISAGATTIECGLLDETIPQRYCVTQNIALKASMLSRDTESQTGQGLPPFQLGTLQSSCSLDETEWFSKGFGGGAAGWLYSGLNFMNTSTTKNIHCDAWVETPVFFISRWNTTDAFQFHDDAMNTFLVYTLLNLDANEMQPVLLDSREPDGPFGAAWSHIFGSTNRLMDIGQLSNGIVGAMQSNTSDPVICFRKAVWGVHGGASAMKAPSEKTDGAPLVKAFRNFMVSRIREAVLGHNSPSLLPLPIPEHLQLNVEREVSSLIQQDQKELDLVQQTIRRVITITYATYNHTAVASSKRIHKESCPLLRTQLHGLTANDTAPPDPPLRGLKPARAASDTRQTQTVLRIAADVWAARHKVRLEMRAVELGPLSYGERVALAQGSDLWIGDDVESLSYLLYLRGDAAVVELVDAGVDAQFAGLCRGLGYAYTRVVYYGVREQKSEASVWEAKMNEAVKGMLDRLAARRDSFQMTE